MGEKTAIEWTDHTFSPWWGCSEVSPGCDNCYARTLAQRFGKNIWGALGDRRTFGDKHWQEPLLWDRKAKTEGVRRRVFCASMADVFEQHPIAEQLRPRLWALIRDTPHLDWQILTKRPGRMAAWGEKHGWPQNAWAGTSVESAKYLPRLDVLARVPAPVRFVSYEPALGPVDLRPYFYRCSGCGTQPCSCKGLALSWVICGGESGPKARPFDLAWARDVKRQCAAAGIAFFMKQLGGVPFQKDSDGIGAFGNRAFKQLSAVRAYLMRDSHGGDPAEWPEDLRLREMPHA